LKLHVKWIQVADNKILKILNSYNEIHSSPLTNTNTNTRTYTNNKMNANSFLPIG
jgi:hypothetical protein